MAQASPPAVHAGRLVRRRNPIATLSAAGVFSALCFVGLAGTAVGPTGGSLGDLGLPDAEPVLASLSYSGPDAVITGSVDHLFEAATFVGPNRAGKTERYKPEVDVADFLDDFEEVRQRIAALRKPADDPVVLAQSQVEIAELEVDIEDAPEGGPRISVAAIDAPAAMPPSSALAAIAEVAPSDDALLPATPSTQLAYARATAPISTGFARGEEIEVADKQLWCLATAIYFEARGETYRGQVAVAQVVLNRVKDHRYPDTICSVVFQNQHRRNACQFSFACDGIPETVSDRTAWAQAEEIAERFTAGELYLTEVADSTHYHATYVRPDWAPRMNRTTQIGLHVFYKFKSGWTFG
jgi:spore germination cell wall hydrolase CwlJ-like protein